MATCMLTKRQISFIKKNRFKMSGTDMAAKFGCRKNLVNKFMRENGLSVPKKLQYYFRTKSKIGKSIVSAYGDFFICCNYLDIPVKTMAEILGYGDGVIQRRVKRLGLIIPAEIIEQRKKDSRIQKGNVPPNKGKKQSDYMSREAIERTKATRFVKGQIPPNKAHYNDGDITIRHRVDRPGSKPHKYIRIKLRVWQELQIFNWEKINGKIPKGHVLACKGGDTLNCDPSNWYLLSMADNARRNSASTNLPDGYVARTIAGKNGGHLMEEILANKELITAKRTTLLINRKIKSIEKQVA